MFFVEMENGIDSALLK